MNLKKLTENAKNATDVAMKESTNNQEQNAVVKKTNQKTKNSAISEAFTELKNENEKLGQQISDLTQKMRLMGENPSFKEKTINQKELAEKVWWKIRKYQAEKRGVELKEK